MMVMIVGSITCLFCWYKACTEYEKDKEMKLDRMESEFRENPQTEIQLSPVDKFNRERTIRQLTPSSIPKTLAPIQVRMPDDISRKSSGILTPRADPRCLT